MAYGEKTGAKARIISPTIATDVTRCVEFYYYMFGSRVGSLRAIQLLTTGENLTLWTAKGNQGQKWHRGFVKVKPGIYQIILEAEMIEGTRNAIALDDVTIQTCEMASEFFFSD